jgi:hypothetical protein
MELVKAIRAASGSQRIDSHERRRTASEPRSCATEATQHRATAKDAKVPVLPLGQPFEEETAVFEADPPCSSTGSPSNVRPRRRKGSIEY